MEQFSLFFLLPLLKCELTDIHVASSLRWDMGVDGIDCRLVVLVNGCYHCLREIKFCKNIAYILGCLSSSDDSNEFCFSGTHSSNQLQFWAIHNSSTRVSESIPSGQSPLLDVVPISSVHKTEMSTVCSGNPSGYSMPGEFRFLHLNLIYQCFVDLRYWLNNTP